MKRGRWIVAALVVLAVIGGGLRMIAHKRAQGLASAPVEPMVELATTDVVTAQQRELLRGLPVSGSLRAVDSAFVKARVPGELQDLRVREGDAVRAGQVSSTLSIFSIIGVVLLMGLVTKNAILLVDFAIRLRAQGHDRTEALLLAARVRLRPILMTTLAMVFGMVPLAFALTEGSEQRAPMGQAVIGGVITSSLLTLVVVPVAYCYLDDFARWLRRGRAPVSAGAGAAVQPASKMGGLS